MEVINKIRKLHHVIGGVINPVSFEFYIICTINYYFLPILKTKKYYMSQQMLSVLAFWLQNASYMILRGMKTLKLRVQQQNTTAMRMAQFLEDHPKVRGEAFNYFF